MPGNELYLNDPGQAYLDACRSTGVLRGSNYPVKPEVLMGYARPTQSRKTLYIHARDFDKYSQALGRPTATLQQEISSPIGSAPDSKEKYEALLREYYQNHFPTTQRYGGEQRQSIGMNPDTANTMARNYMASIDNAITRQGLNGPATYERYSEILKSALRRNGANSTTAAYSARTSVPETASKQDSQVMTMPNPDYA